MFNTLSITTALAILTVGVGFAATIHIQEESQKLVTHAAVEAHEEILTGLLQNNAEALCPAIGDDEAGRAALQCERFGL